MDESKLGVLFQLLEKKLKTVKRSLELSREDSIEAQKTATTSWSGAGDRRHSAQQLEIIEDNYENIKKLRDEISKALGKNKERIVKAPCFVEIETENRQEEFFIVGNVMNIKEFKLVSSKSPFVKGMLGKRVGDVIIIKGSEELEKGKIIRIN